MNVLADPTILNGDVASCHVLSYASNTDKRVCSSTLQAESHAMIAGTDNGDKLRAIIAGMRGQLDLKHWEATSASAMPHLWLSDCESLVSHLKNPKDERLENTRLSIDVQGLKQLLWTAEDGTQFDELPDPKIARNAIRWIDTSAMPVDCMTKRMKPESLIPVLNGRLDLTPTAASTMLKIRKQKLRRNKSETRREAEDAYASTTAVAKKKEDSTTFSSENTNVQLH